MNNKDAIKELQESHDMLRTYNVDESESRLMQALNMAISALERQKCENCKILELLVDMEIPTICEDDYNDCEYCEQNCNFKAPTKECYLHWAEQEPKTGKWKFVCQHWRKCSECGFSHKFAEDWNFCPNCGVRMESEDKE